MNVVLAHPEGYELMPEVVETAHRMAAEGQGQFSVVCFAHSAHSCISYLSSDQQYG